MIQDLENLKPLQDLENRKMMVKKKSGLHASHKKHLTKRARQWAWFGSQIGMDKYKGPRGKKSYGNVPLKERSQLSKQQGVK